MVKELKINPKFRDAAIPLSKEKFEELKADIRRRGCLVPIVTCDGTIVDGHNRYAICREYGIHYETVEQHFEDEVDARIWIVNNVMNSREPTSFQRCEMVIPFKDDIGSKALQRQLAGVKADLSANLREGSYERRTDTLLGKMAKVSANTMRMAMRLHEEADESVLERLREDKLSISGAFKKVFGKDKPSKNVSSAPREEPLSADKSANKTEPKVKKKPITVADGPASAPEVLSNDSLDSNAPEKKDLELYPEVTQLNHLMEVPTMKDEPQSEPHAFMFVDDQVRFACRNYIAELQTGLRWLKDEDKNRLPELLQIIKEANKQAEHMYKEMED